MTAVAVRADSDTSPESNVDSPSATHLANLGAQAFWRYWTGPDHPTSLARAFVDGLEWYGLMTRRERPTWSTKYAVVKTNAFARLLNFSVPSAVRVIPTLVFPPQAGHASCVVDYLPAQSQIRTLRDSGLTEIFSLDWLGITQTTKHTSIEDYIQFIDEAVAHLGGKANLVGDCQGGWLATIYAGLYPEKVNTLTIGGAPIDFHAGEPMIWQSMQKLAPGGNLAFYKGLVASGNGVLKGDIMLHSFIGMQPEGEFRRQLDLAAHMHDPEYVARYKQFEDWFKFTQNLGGDFYLWIVQHLFRDNELIKGELYVGGRLVDLKKITCPLFLLGGKTDHITLPIQVFRLGDFTSTPKRKVKKRTAPGGHLGLFMGHHALQEYWAPIGKEVYLLSII